VPEPRVLPIPAEHREFTVKVGGEALPREHQLLAVSISTVANRIARARLCFLDGAAAAGDFPLSSTGLLVPGQEVEILAGAGRQTHSLFTGLVVRHALRVRDHSPPQLIVDCRHAAVKLTAVRRSASFFDQSDSEIIEALLAAAGLEGEVEPTSFKHLQVVQFQTSDWDFLLARAEANGQLVLPRDGKLAVKKPALTGSPVCSLQFGATLLAGVDLIDARQQYAAVRGVSWDPSQQTRLEVEAEDPEFTGPGNLAPAELAAVAAAERLDMCHAALVESEAQAWANAVWLRSRLNKVSGRCKCEGLGSVNPGDVVTLAGVGARFNGDVFVTGVRQEFDLVQGWKTHVQFGGLDGARPAAGDISAPPAGGLLARVAGLQLGVVVSNEDPDGEHRVRIRLPLVSNEDDGIWARVASLDAGTDRGFFFRPEIGDEVVVGFLDEDPRCAVILGMLHSSARAAPLAGSDENHEKVYRSRAGLRLYFNDEQKVVQLDTPVGNRLTLSDTEKSLVLADQNGNRIELTADGIRIESAKALTLKAGTEAGLEAGTELKLAGTATAELSGGTETTVKGGLVRIN